MLNIEEQNILHIKFKLDCRTIVDCVLNTEADLWEIREDGAPVARVHTQFGSEYANKVFTSWLGGYASRLTPQKA